MTTQGGDASENTTGRETTPNGMNVLHPSSASQAQGGKRYITTKMAIARLLPLMLSTARPNFRAAIPRSQRAPSKTVECLNTIDGRRHNFSHLFFHRSSRTSPRVRPPVPPPAPAPPPGRRRYHPEHLRRLIRDVSIPRSHVLTVRVVAEHLHTVHINVSMMMAAREHDNGQKKMS